ncbi:MAG TPA: hypothetical protein VGE62_03220 [Candidatus Paceibacterota bacterium]
MNATKEKEPFHIQRQKASQVLKMISLIFARERFAEHPDRPVLLVQRDVPPEMILRRIIQNETAGLRALLPVAIILFVLMMSWLFASFLLPQAGWLILAFLAISVCLLYASADHFNRKLGEDEEWVAGLWASWKQSLRSVHMLEKLTAGSLKLLESEAALQKQLEEQIKHGSCKTSIEFIYLIERVLTGLMIDAFRNSDEKGALTLHECALLLNKKTPPLEYFKGEARKTL